MELLYTNNISNIKSENNSYQNSSWKSKDIEPIIEPIIWLFCHWNNYFQNLVQGVLDFVGNELKAVHFFFFFFCEHCYVAMQCL